MLIIFRHSIPCAYFCSHQHQASCAAAEIVAVFTVPAFVVTTLSLFAFPLCQSPPSPLCARSRGHHPLTPFPMNFSVCTHSHQGLDTVSHADGVAGLSQDTFHAALATATGVSWAPSAGFRAQLYIARPVILLPSPVAVMRFKCSSTATAPLF